VAWGVCPKRSCCRRSYRVRRATLSTRARTPRLTTARLLRSPEPIEVLGGGVLEINGWAQDHEGEQDMISFEIDIDSVTFA
jgi:hypothetical protein